MKKSALLGLSALLATTFITGCTASYGNFTEENKRSIKIEGQNSYALDNINKSKWVFEVSKIRKDSNEIFSDSLMDLGVDLLDRRK